MNGNDEDSGGSGDGGASAAPRILPIGGKAGARRAKGGCTLCGKPVVEAYRPFCSKRCADIDLHRWFSDSYRLPTNERPESDAGEGQSGGDDGEGAASD